MRLKAAAWVAASLLLAVAVPALADDLVVGVVTDQDGVPVAGARLVPRAAAGAALGSGSSAADGSFAVTVPAGADASRLEVGCAYCLGRTVALAPGEPAVVIVQRFRALRERGAPGREDFAALPPQTLAGAAGLIPFAVTAGGGVSDRGLVLGRDASAADGIPLYRRGDGISLANLVPAVALRRLELQDGAFEAELASAGAPALRVATSAAGGAAAAVGGARAALLAADGNDRYELAAAAARLPFAGGTLSSTALAAVWDDERLAGATLAYATASRRYDTSASLALARSVVGPVAEAELLADAHLRARTPAGVTLGLRGRRSSAAGPAPGGQAEDAAYAGASAPLPGGTLAAALAVGRQLYPSLAYDTSPGRGWRLHAGLLTYAVPPAPGDPGAFARARRAELSLERSDLRRLDLLATIYQERARGPGLSSDLSGAGLQLDWQIAPRLALRSWLLGADRDVLSGPGGYPAGPVYPPPAAATYGYGPPAALSARIDRRLAWLTYENALRVDLVYRGGPLDASLSAPLGGARLGLGTTTAIDGRRVLSLALTR